MRWVCGGGSSCYCGGLLRRVRGGGGGGGGGDCCCFLFLFLFLFFFFKFFKSQLCVVVFEVGSGGYDCCLL